MPERLDRGRFTIVCYPRDDRLARSLLARALATDSFPGLPRPRERVLIAIAPDRQHFRSWVGPSAPNWGAAITFPESHRVVLQGSDASSEAGNPVDVLRHELAHLALHEFEGDLPPRWFDEGYASYAARELDRNEVLAANLALAIRGMPSLDELDDEFNAGSSSAQAAYALAYRAVDEMASIDPQGGLTLLFRYWPSSGSLDVALRKAYGVTLAGFEQRWQASTRRRYGMLALFGDLALTGVLMLVIVLPLYVARRRRDRRRLDALRAADAAAERAQRASVLAMLLGGAGNPGEGGPATEDRDDLPSTAVEGPEAIDPDREPHA